MEPVKKRQKAKTFLILQVKVLALCAILVLFMLSSVSCIDEPSDWLSSLRGELSLSVRVVRRSTGEEIKASLTVLAPNDAEGERAERAYTLKYLSPETLCGLSESFDGKTLTLSLDGFESASFDYGTESTATLSLGARVTELFTPSAVKEVKSGGTYTEIVTDNAIYYVDGSGSVREISSSEIRIIIESYQTN